jgi:hypothetical protein
MYYQNTMPPPWMWPSGPTSQPQLDPAQQIAGWITSLEALKKHFKEEKKPDDKKKPEQPSLFGVALLMILISPVTGPLMYRFFQLSLKMLP